MPSVRIALLDLATEFRIMAEQQRRAPNWVQASSIRIDVSAEDISGRRAEPVMYVCCERFRAGFISPCPPTKIDKLRKQARWLSRDRP